MTLARTAIQDFSTSNKVYANATVTFYTVSGGVKTTTLATLYSSLSGSTELANPQTLDAYGKLAQPVYIDDAVIATVTGLGNTPDHDTGIVGVPDLLSAVVTISSAQLLALHSTEKTLVAAPGAGKALIFDHAIFFLDYNSAAYAGIAAGDDINIKYTNASGVTLGTLETTGFLDQTADTYAQANHNNASPILLAANAPLVASLAGAVTTGNSPVVVRTFYRIAQLSTMEAS